MKVIIAGSRSITDYISVERAINESGFAPEITEIVSGAAPGVDRLGEKWARARNIHVRIMHADWNGLGRAAGFARNDRMSMYADALVAIWDGESRGTMHMIRTAIKRGLEVSVYLVE